MPAETNLTADNATLSTGDATQDDLGLDATAGSSEANATLPLEGSGESDTVKPIGMSEDQLEDKFLSIYNLWRINITYGNVMRVKELY